MNCKKCINFDACSLQTLTPGGPSGADAAHCSFYKDKARFIEKPSKCDDSRDTLSDVILFADSSYDTALLGVTADNRAVYDYTQMIEWLVEHFGLPVEDAEEWINSNTAEALVSAGDRAPIIMYPLED